MGISSEEMRVKEQTIFYIQHCVTTFCKLRPNRDGTKDVFSPCLTDISKCSSFQDLIHLCSEHDPKTLNSVLQIAHEKCAKAVEQIKKEESKKREAETQLGAENYKQAKVQRLDKAHAAPTHQSQVMLNVLPVSKARLPFNALRPRVNTNQDSQIISQASTTQRSSAVLVQASTSSKRKHPRSVNQLAPTMSSPLHLANVSKDVVPRCDQRSRAENTRDWTGIEFDRESEEEMENVSDTYREDSDLQHTSPDVDMESSRMANRLRSSVTASPSSPATVLANNATKTQTPTIYEVEKGLVRGVEKIRKYVVRECLSFKEDYGAKKWYNPAKELRNLFPVFQKLPFEIVKDKLLVELGSRIMVPGQKTAIASTVDLVNPSDILDALQCIKMTTINAKVNRAYGQMRLFNSVQSKINGGFVPDDALTHGVASHTSILAKMAYSSAGNVSEKERSERRNSFDYEYDAGKKWVDVTKWFGGEGIVLIFLTAGGWN